MSFRILSCFLRNQNPIISRISRIQRRTLSTAKEDGEAKDEPIKYSTSKAGQWQAKYSTSGKQYFTTPKSQSTWIMMSLTAFMVWFCILREENDLDDWLRDLETQVPLKLEEGQLRGQIEHGKRNRIDVSSYERRLKTVLELQEKVRVASGQQ